MHMYSHDFSILMSYVHLVGNEQAVIGYIMSFIICYVIIIIVVNKSTSFIFFISFYYCKAY